MHSYQEKTEETRETLQIKAQSMRATTSTGEAVEKAVEHKNQSTTDLSKLMTKTKTLTTRQRTKKLRHLERGHGPLRRPWFLEEYLSAVGAGLHEGLAGKS